MEQTTQQIVQKASLPVKTKIAAWCMKVVGEVLIILSLLGTLYFWNDSFGGAMPAGLYFFIFIFPFGLLLFFLPGTFLSKRKRWAWWFSVIMLFIAIFTPFSAPDFLIGLFIPYPSFFYTALGLINRIIPLVFFILLILDRKNFFRIAS